METSLNVTRKSDRIQQVVDDAYSKSNVQSTGVMESLLDASGIKDEVVFTMSTAELMDTLMAVDLNNEYEYDEETMAEIMIECSGVLGVPKSFQQVARELGNDCMPPRPEPGTPEEELWLAEAKARAARRVGLLEDDETEATLTKEEMEL